MSERSREKQRQRDMTASQKYYRKVINTTNEGGIWMYPGANSVFRVSHQDHTFTQTAGPNTGWGEDYNFVKTKNDLAFLGYRLVLTNPQNDRKRLTRDTLLYAIFIPQTNGNGLMMAGVPMTFGQYRETLEKTPEMLTKTGADIGSVDEMLRYEYELTDADRADKIAVYANPNARLVLTYTAVETPGRLLRAKPYFAEIVE